MEPYDKNHPVVAAKEETSDNDKETPKLMDDKGKEVIPEVFEPKDGEEVKNIPSNLGSVQQSQLKPTTLHDPIDDDEDDDSLLKQQFNSSGVNLNVRDGLGVVDEVGRQTVYESETKKNLEKVEESKKEDKDA